MVDVDYGGSTGYGRAYRERLRHRWGIVDVDDCVAAASSLAAAGRVDGDRMVIRGGSAGGYTALAALAFRDVFAAGASHYGVSDLSALVAHTHKFESRYLDDLVGPWPEAQPIYKKRRRSTTSMASGARSSCGGEVVPQLSRRAAKARGIPVGTTRSG